MKRKKISMDKEIDWIVINMIKKKIKLLIFWVCVEPLLKPISTNMFPKKLKKGWYMYYKWRDWKSFYLTLKFEDIYPTIEIFGLLIINNDLPLPKRLIVIFVSLYLRQRYMMLPKLSQVINLRDPMATLWSSLNRRENFLKETFWIFLKNSTKMELSTKAMNATYILSHLITGR